MDAPTPPSSPPRGPDLGRLRDANILWYLDTHPVTADMLVCPGWFPNKHKALKRLRHLVARRRIRLVGTVARKTGRPEHVYCRYRVKPDSILHEVQITELCLRLHAAAILRGPHLEDHEFLPDADVRIKGDRYFLELDRGTMTYPQIASRFRTYERCPHFSLWVCPTVERREGLRRRAGTLRSTALFTTFAEALADPHATIWWDVHGKTAALPREETRSS